MSPQVRNTVLACVGLMAVMLALFIYNAVREHTPTDAELHEAGIILLPKPRALTDFALTGSTGEPFTNGALEGKWTFAYFGFTNCPDICPLAMSMLGQARRKLAERGRDDYFSGVLVSVDPARDTAEVLRAYVRYFHEEFVGVTGDRDAIAALASQVSVAFAAIPQPEAPDGYVVDHTGNIVLLNPHGHYHGYIRPPHSAGQLVLAFEALSPRF